MQIFIGDPVTLGNKDIEKIMEPKSIKKVRQFIFTNKIHLFVHSCYLTKLTGLPEKSKTQINSLVNEMKSAFLLGADGVVVHCGSKRSQKGLTMKKKEALFNLINNATEVINKFCTAVITTWFKQGSTKKISQKFKIVSHQISQNNKNQNNKNQNNKQNEDVGNSDAKEKTKIKEKGKDREKEKRSLIKLKVPRLLFEISAGSGKEIGKKISDLKFIIDGLNGEINKFTNEKQQIAILIPGLCLDTCHMFANNYDLRYSESVKSIFSEFGDYTRYIGLFHFNDAGYAKGSHMDVHQSVGCGYITKKKGGSFDGFIEIIKLAKKMRIPMVLETQSRNCESINNNLKSEGISEKITKFTPFDKELLVVYLLSVKNNEKINKEDNIYKHINYCY